MVNKNKLYGYDLSSDLDPGSFPGDEEVEPGVIKLASLDSVVSTKHLETTESRRSKGEKQPFLTLRAESSCLFTENCSILYSTGEENQTNPNPRP